MNQEHPTFEEYVTARKVLFYELEQMRKSGRKINVACDPIISKIIFKSSPTMMNAYSDNHSAECGMVMGRKYE